MKKRVKRTETSVAASFRPSSYEVILGCNTVGLTTLAKRLSCSIEVAEFDTLIDVISETVVVEVWGDWMSLDAWFREDLIKDISAIFWSGVRKSGRLGIANPSAMYFDLQSRYRLLMPTGILVGFLEPKVMHSRYASRARRCGESFKGSVSTASEIISWMRDWCLMYSCSMIDVEKRRHLSDYLIDPSTGKSLAYTLPEDDVPYYLDQHRFWTDVLTDAMMSDDLVLSLRHYVADDEFGSCHEDTFLALKLYLEAYANGTPIPTSIHQQEVPEVKEGGCDA
jgi:hypothetical protein